jgi:hypothetical protein
MSDLPSEASAALKVVWRIGHNKRGNRGPGLALILQDSEEVIMIRDPRSEAEKARADLARNDELGMAVPESPPEREPSVTPKTFGDTTQKADLVADPEGTEARRLEQDDGDSTGTGTIPPSSEVPVWPEDSETQQATNDEDVLSRAKE